MLIHVWTLILSFTSSPKRSFSLPPLCQIEVVAIALFMFLSATTEIFHFDPSSIMEIPSQGMEDPAAGFPREESL